MGITGLLPFIDKASHKCNIADFRGCTVAIDTYCWLHKGAFACAEKLIRGEDTDVYVLYCLKYVNMLLSKNIKPILVFDGRHLPAKALTEDKRRESRKAAKKRAAELLRLEKFEEARSFMRRGVDVTHEMALNLIKECRKRNVDCIVAPYEADAQLAFLNINNLADIVITEDSDLILFGCTKILFKMDLAGNGTLVESSKLPLVMKCPIEKYDFNKFRRMCIMSGCDYLPSLPSIGLVKARQFINTVQDPDISNALRKLPSFFNKSQIVVSDEYRDNFLKAEATFKHQLVYDPSQRKMVPLTNPDDEGTDRLHCSNAGELLDSQVSFQLALGNLDPFTLRKLDDWDPDCRDLSINGVKSNGWNQVKVDPHPSIWSPDYLLKIRKIGVCKNDSNKPAAIDTMHMRSVAKKIVNIVSPIRENLQNGLTIEELNSMYREEPVAKKRRIIVEETQSFTQDIIEVKTPTKSRNPFAVQVSGNTVNHVRRSEEVSPTLTKPQAIVDKSNLIKSKNPFAVSKTGKSTSIFNKPRVIVEDSQMPDGVTEPPVRPISPCLSNINDDSLTNSSQKENVVTPKKICNSKKELSPILEIKGRHFKKMMQSSSYSVLRKLSKFDRTSLDSGDPVESRFFGSNSTKINNSSNFSSDSACIIEDDLNGIQRLSRLSDILDNDATSPSHDDSINNRILTEDKFDWSESNRTSDTNNSSFSIYDNSPAEEDSDKLKPLITPTEPQDSQYLDSVSHSSNSQESPEWLSKTTHSKIISKPYQNSVVPKKITCKRPGLQKRSPMPNKTNQQSLLTMFGFKKRSTLKH